MQTIINNSISFDLVIDTTGDSILMSKSFEMLKETGTLLIIGVMPHDQKLSINTLALNMGKKIIGSQGGSSLPQFDVPRLAKILENNMLPLGALSYKERSLNEINLSIKEMRNGVPLKQYINMQ
jgi:S-(hydroxymethyl)glutathione dehydrogenase/alcohol dehydrogenase